MKQPAGQNAVRAAFVFLDLLERDAEAPGQRFLAESQGETSEPQSGADGNVNGIGDRRRSSNSLSHTLDLSSAFDPAAMIDRKK
jgi:hypothetical protein